MDPTSPVWIFAQFVKWAKDIGGPYVVYRLVQSRKILVWLLVIESLALLGIGTYEFVKNRKTVADWCRRKLSKIKVNQEDLNEANEIMALLNQET